MALDLEQLLAQFGRLVEAHDAQTSDDGDSQAENFRCEDCVGCRNCRFCTGCRGCSECTYCERSVDCRGCTQGVELLECTDCSHSAYSAFCDQSAYVVLSYECRKCVHCLGCVGQTGQEFCILNQKYARREYFETVSKLKAELEARVQAGLCLPWFEAESPEDLQPEEPDEPDERAERAEPETPGERAEEVVGPVAEPEVVPRVRDSKSDETPELRAVDPAPGSWAGAPNSRPEPLGDSGDVLLDALEAFHRERARVAASPASPVASPEAMGGSEPTGAPPSPPPPASVAVPLAAEDRWEASTPAARVESGARWDAPRRLVPAGEEGVPRSASRWERRPSPLAGDPVSAPDASARRWAGPGSEDTGTPTAGRRDLLLPEPAGIGGGPAPQPPSGPDPRAGTGSSLRVTRRPK